MTIRYRHNMYSFASTKIKELQMNTYERKEILLNICTVVVTKSSSSGITKELGFQEGPPGKGHCDCRNQFGEVFHRKAVEHRKVLALLKEMNKQVDKDCTVGKGEWGKFDKIHQQIIRDGQKQESLKGTGMHLEFDTTEQRWPTCSISATSDTGSLYGTQ